jgi:hypothetical protein
MEENIRLARERFAKAPEILQLHFSIDIAQHALNRSRGTLRKKKFQEALDQRRRYLIDEGSTAVIEAGRKSLLRSISYYELKALCYQSASAVRAIVYSGGFLPSFVEDKSILGWVTYYGINTATHQYRKSKGLRPNPWGPYQFLNPWSIGEFINPWSIGEFEWQCKRFEYLIEVSKFTERLWLVYDNPEALPPVPEECSLDYRTNPPPPLGEEGENDE